MSICISASIYMYNIILWFSFTFPDVSKNGTFSIGFVGTTEKVNLQLVSSDCIPCMKIICRWSSSFLWIIFMSLGGFQCFCWLHQIYDLKTTSPTPPLCLLLIFWLSDYTFRSIMIQTMSIFHMSVFHILYVQCLYVHIPTMSKCRYCMVTHFMVKYL